MYKTPKEIKLHDMCPTSAYVAGQSAFSIP